MSGAELAGMLVGVIAIAAMFANLTYVYFNPERMCVCKKANFYNLFINVRSVQNKEWRYVFPKGCLRQFFPGRSEDVRCMGIMIAWNDLKGVAKCILSIFFCCNPFESSLFYPCAGGMGMCGEGVIHWCQGCGFSRVTV